MSETDQACYVYGVMRTEALPRPLTGVGVDGASPLELASYDGLAAVFSRVPLADYEPESLAQRLNDIAWLEARVRAHAAVVAVLCRYATMVPFRFGGLFRTEERVREMLGAHAPQFAEALARLDGTQEWGVKMYVDRGRLAQTVEASCSAIRDLQAKLASQSPGAAYLGRKRLERALIEAVTGTIDECARGSQQRLSACAEDAVLLDAPHSAAASPQSEPALSAAYLVAQTRRREFQAELERLRRKYTPQGFTHESSGPWPPYNFVEASRVGCGSDG